MDYNYIENLIREEIKEKCPNLSNEIVEEFLDFTFFRNPWVTYGNNEDLYILGIAKGKYDFYYLGCTQDFEIKLISCALDIKRNRKRDNDYITTFNTDFKLWSKEADNNWKKIRKNIKEYFKNHKEDKLLYFQDHILQDEHLDKNRNIEKI